MSSVTDVGAIAIYCSGIKGDIFHRMDNRTDVIPSTIMNKEFFHKMTHMYIPALWVEVTASFTGKTRKNTVFMVILRG